MKAKLMKRRDEKQLDLIVSFITPAPIYFTIPAATLQFERGRKKTELQTSAKNDDAKKNNCSEYFPRTDHSRWWWRFSLLRFLLHLFNLRSLGGHGVSGRLWFSAHVVKWNVFRPALALRWSGRGGRGEDGLGFARPNKLHKPRIWDVEMEGLHKHCSLICLENKWAQLMSTCISGIINTIPSWDKSFCCSSKISVWDIAWSLAWFSSWILIVSPVLSRTGSPWPDTSPGPVMENRRTVNNANGGDHN